MKIERFSKGLTLVGDDGKVKRYYSKEEEELLKKYFIPSKILTPQQRAESALRSHFPHLADDSILAKRIGELIEDAAFRGVDWTEEGAL